MLDLLLPASVPLQQIMARSTFGLAGHRSVIGRYLEEKSIHVAKMTLQGDDR